MNNFEENGGIPESNPPTGTKLKIQKAKIKIQKREKWNERRET